jgi:NAD(P)-dependent dehydrogenase (short-subunit alcohol dehydrogenase family)
MMGRLSGKVAIITGAAGGIGSVAARAFGEEGAALVLLDRDEAALAALAATLPAARVVTLAGDVAEEVANVAAVERAHGTFGRVDVALLNAAIEGEIGLLGELPVGAFDRVMAVNVRSVWLGLSALMPAMRAGGGGSIVVTSSVAGLRGSPRLAAYSASKHAVVGLAKSAAIEGAPHGIRVNTVNPAQTRTPMMDKIDASMDAAGRTASPVARIPMARYAEPSEIVPLMLFLASDESRYCTGGTYLVDGGTMA